MFNERQESIHFKGLWRVRNQHTFSEIARMFNKCIFWKMAYHAEKKGKEEGKIASCGIPRVGRDAEHFPPYTVSCPIPERQERSHLDTQLSELTLTYLLSGTYLAIETKVEV